MTSLTPTQRARLEALITDELRDLCAQAAAHGASPTSIARTLETRLRNLKALPSKGN